MLLASETKTGNLYYQSQTNKYRLYRDVLLSTEPAKNCTIYHKTYDVKIKMLHKCKNNLFILILMLAWNHFMKKLLILEVFLKFLLLTQTIKVHFSALRNEW